MLQLILKTLISAVLITLISEIAKRNSLFAAIIASIPLTSVLSIIWIYHDTHSLHKISQLSKDICWLVLPSISLFIALPLLLKHHIHFYLSLTLSVAIMVGCYFLSIYLFRYLLP